MYNFSSKRRAVLESRRVRQRPGLAVLRVWASPRNSARRRGALLESLKQLQFIYSCCRVSG